METNKFYKKLSPYYDNFVNNSILEFYLKKIGNVNGMRILDLGCGTGDLIKNYSPNNETLGIDSSSEMIKIARKKDKKTEYINQDIKRFNFKKDFHIIICAFDTINHLKSIREWESLFKSASENLLKEGLFLFDFNTLKGFETFDSKAMFKKIGEDFLVMHTKKQDQNCIWTVDIFKRKTKNTFIREEISVKERSYDNDIIFKKVKKYFKKVDFTEDKDGSRVYVVARK